jgi:hypothetical protein
MLIYDVPFNQCERIAENLGIRFDGNETHTKRQNLVRVNGRLLPPNDGRRNPYQRISASVFHDDRKVAAVCWHGYRDFMMQLFEDHPEARIVTTRQGYISYNGLDDFKKKYQDTAWVEVGSKMYPRYACEVCICPESGRG